MTRSTIAQRDLASLVLAASCWGIGTVISKAALEEIPPLTLLSVQLAASVAVLLVLRAVRGSERRTPVPGPLGRLGILNPGMAYALGLLGLTTISASLAVLLWAFEPLIILVLASIVLAERVTIKLVTLSLVAAAGMGLVVVDPSTGIGQWIGIALTLAGVACCAVYSVASRRLLPGTQETLGVVFVQQAYALAFALVAVVMVAALGGQMVPSALTPIGLASAIASGVLYYAGAYWFYLGALRRVPASLAAMSFYLIPVIGAAAAAVLLGDKLGPTQWLGAAIVVGALAAIGWSQRRPRQDQTVVVVAG